jgi:hypothetical protein
VTSTRWRPDLCWAAALASDTGYLGHGHGTVPVHARCRLYVALRNSPVLGVVAFTHAHTHVRMRTRPRSTRTRARTHTGTHTRARFLRYAADMPFQSAKHTHARSRSRPHTSGYPPRQAASGTQLPLVPSALAPLPLLIELQRSAFVTRAPPRKPELSGASGVLCFDAVQPVQRSHQYFRDRLEARCARTLPRSGACGLFIVHGPRIACACGLFTVHGVAWRCARPPAAVASAGGRGAERGARRVLS